MRSWIGFCALLAAASIGGRFLFRAPRRAKVYNPSASRGTRPKCAAYSFGRGPRLALGALIPLIEHVV